MRGAVEGLRTRVPVVEQLPAIYQEDEFTRSFLGGFDEVLAPVLATLDCLDAYVDPYLCPPDFLEWLASWMGMTLDDDWPEHRRRQLVAAAIYLFRMRGTVPGLRAELGIYTGGYVEVMETGGTVWSQTPGAALPGASSPRLVVQVFVDDPDSINRAGLEAVVAAAKPAHVPHEIEVIGRARPLPPPPPGNGGEGGDGAYDAAGSENGGNDWGAPGYGDDGNGGDNGAGEYTGGGEGW
jgi:phage tail-like protein